MLYTGDIVDNTYQVCEEIGSGGMGVVYLAYHLRLDKYVVMKKMKNSAADMQMLRNEVDVLKSLHHPYLPQVYDFIRYDGDVYTIIDYIDGYDLKYYIDNAVPIDESQLIKWLGQLCEVLVYLHSHVPRVLHTDIKPANIIVTNGGDICLIDFGISMLGDEEIKGFSVDYSSPEQYYNVACIREGYYDSLLDLDERTDIYSLGATFYHLITYAKPSCMSPLVSSLEYRCLPVSDYLCEIIDKAVAYDREERFADAQSMLKAVRDIYKRSSRYRTYILIQIAASVLSCIMILMGGYLIVKSFNNQIVSAYEEDYNLYIEALRRDDSDTAISYARKLINTSDYRSMMDDEARAEVFHGMGDCYRAIGDRQNALDCYHQAVLSAGKAAGGDIYYCDYALMLIDCDRVAEAKSVLGELNSLYPDSASGYLILAQLDVREGNIGEARTKVSTALGRTSNPDTLFTAYVLLGDIEIKSGVPSEAVRAYTSAKDCKVNAYVLRRLGAAQMELARTSGDTSLYRAASESFALICGSYVPTEDDAFNLAQCYLLTGDPGAADKCISSLKDYINRYGEKCRAYILMAVAADSVGDDYASVYCDKAHSLYRAMSDEEKSRVDAESLSAIRKLYRKYFKEEW